MRVELGEDGGSNPPCRNFSFFVGSTCEPTILDSVDMISLVAEALSPHHRLVRHDVQWNLAWMVYPI